MDNHPPARRLHAFSRSNSPPLPAFSNTPTAHHRPESSGSESDSSSSADDGGSAPRGHRYQPNYATAHAHYASQNPVYDAPQRSSNALATFYVDDPPYIPREAQPRPPPSGHGHVQRAFADEHFRLPPLPPHTPSTDYTDRRSSSSPTGSVRSELSGASDGSGHESERSVSSHAGSHEHRPRVQGVHLGRAFHAREPVNAPEQPPFNQERYPAYDAQARRIGMEHVRYDTVPHDPSGQTYYRPRTRTYPPPGVAEGPRIPSMAGDPPARSPDIPHTREEPPLVASVPTTHHMERQASPEDIRFDYSGHMEPPHAFPLPLSPSPPAMATGYIGLPNIPDPMANVVPIDAPSNPDDELTLDMLADPAYSGQKPNYPYPTLVKAAILGSPKKRLTLQEIYQALQDRFQWFRDNASDKAWQNSIRHNLSLNKVFRRMPRDITEPGKGSYWTVDFEAGAGNKRERKRNKRPTKAERARRAAQQSTASSSRQQGDHSSSEDEDSNHPTSQTRSRSQSIVQTPVSVTRSEDNNIDPELLSQGHMVGQRRARAESGTSTRSNARRRQSPYTHSQAGAHAQPVTFGQPSFGQPSFGTFQSTFTTGPQPLPPAQPVKTTSTGPTFRVTMPGPGGPPQTASSPSGRTTRSMTAAAAQAVDIRNTLISLPNPRAGIEHVHDDSGLVVARRIGAESSGTGSGSGAAVEITHTGGNVSADAYRQGSATSSSQD